MQTLRWLPLEANPDFLKQLGVGASWQFVDVYGLDAELLSLIPRPVCAVLLLLPITEKYELFRAEEEEKIKCHGQDVDSSVYFMKQTISNACGTIGLIHAVANNREKLCFGAVVVRLCAASVYYKGFMAFPLFFYFCHPESDSALKKFLDESISMSPEERAKFLERDESIRVTHESSAQEGQSEAPNIDDKVDLHFVAFVHLQSHLYELDGCKPFPVNHGHTSEDTLLEDAIEVCRKFMQRDPDELRFTVVAFSKV